MNKTEICLKAFNGAKGNTRVPVFYRYEGENFLILRGRDFVSEKSFTLPVPFPSVYFNLLNNVITSREVLQKLSVWPSKLVMYLVALSPVIKFQSVYLM